MSNSTPSPTRWDVLAEVRAKNLPKLMNTAAIVRDAIGKAGK